MDNSIIQTYAGVIAALLGVLVPIVVAFFTKRTTSSKAKGWFAFFLSFVCGLVMAVASGEVISLSADPGQAIADAAKYIGIVAISAQTAYNMWIKPSGLSEAVQANLGVTDAPGAYIEPPAPVPAAPTPITIVASEVTVSTGTVVTSSPSVEEVAEEFMVENPVDAEVTL